MQKLRTIIHSSCRVTRVRHPGVTMKLRVCKRWSEKDCGSRTCKPNSVREIAPAGRPFLWAAHHCAALATYPEVGRTGPARVRCRSRGLPPYLVLLRVGFAMPAPSLSRRCALAAPFHPYLAVADEAVSFLWHFPSIRLEPDVPDVIRHTALRSSDFPLLAPEDARSGRPVRLPTSRLY